jgi:hypothetical protein
VGIRIRRLASSLATRVSMFESVPTAAVAAAAVP